jgi:LacI family transcriptional regulator
MPLPRKLKPARAATLADVGQAAGVSAMAASAVLNGAQTSSRIAPETRERIMSAAARLRYRPNAAARALANRRMDTIGVAAVIDGGGLSSYFLEIFNGIIEAAARHEQNTTVFALHDWGRDPARLMKLCDGRIDGLILLAPKLNQETVKLLPDYTPFVAVHANEPLPNIVNIETDEERGAYEMMRLIIAQGHRRIMHIAGPSYLLGAERRLRAYKRALASARIPVDEELIVPVPYLIRDRGREAMQRWLREHVGAPLPQALFCINDSVATGCLEALAEVGLRVPEDISVVGFDDTIAARTTVPQLATVRQPLRAMGNRAVEVLMYRIAEHSGAARVVSLDPIVFPVDIVTRGSLGPPPEAGRLVPAPPEGG